MLEVSSRAVLVGLLCAVPTIAHGQQATATERYALQERCGKQASGVFQKEWPEAVVNIKDGGQIVANFENHYNARLNKCFYLEITTTVNRDATSIKNLRLFDLLENREYGTYSHTDNRITHTFALCTVQGTRCETEEEWRRLAKPYLED